MTNQKINQLFPTSNQWRYIQQKHGVYIFTHLYSQDQCQGHILQRVNLRQVDLYASRQIYSYPFCPKIYKCTTGRNTLIDNQLFFQVSILVESVFRRLGQKQSKFQDVNLIDIIKGFNYLFNRYGPFKPTEDMIGYTKEGVVKVWYNADFTSNSIGEDLKNEEEMVSELVDIINRNQCLSRSKLNMSRSFVELLIALKKKIKSSRQVNFQQGVSLDKQNRLDFMPQNQKIKEFINCQTTQRKLKRANTYGINYLSATNSPTNFFNTNNNFKNLMKKGNLNSFKSCRYYNVLTQTKPNNNEKSFRSCFFDNVSNVSKENDKGIDTIKNSQTKLNKTCFQTSRQQLFQNKKKIKEKTLVCRPRSQMVGDQSRMNTSIRTEFDAAKDFFAKKQLRFRRKDRCRTVYVTDSDKKIGNSYQKEQKSNLDETYLYRLSLTISPKRTQKFDQPKTDRQSNKIVLNVKKPIDPVNDKQQTLKEDLDALFDSEQPTIFDESQLERELDAVFFCQI